MTVKRLFEPASGTGVERVFSIARSVHNYHRGHLLPSTVKKLMIVNYYLRLMSKSSNDDETLQGQATRTNADAELIQQCQISDDKDDNTFETELPLAATSHFSTPLSSVQAGKRPMPPEFIAAESQTRRCSARLQEHS